MDLVKKHKYDIALILFLLIFVVIFVFLRDKFGILSDRESFELFVKSFGVWAPLVIILTIILEVVIAPIPGFIPAITAGFIFGALEGSVYTYIGNVLGSFLVFWLSRKFGRMILERFAAPEKIEKYENIIARRENFLLPLYIFPFIPVDIISGAFGLSKIDFRKFAVAVSVGFVIHVLILTFFGDWLARLYFMR